MPKITNDMKAQSARTAVERKAVTDHKTRMEEMPEKTKESLEHMRVAMAEKIGCDPSEITISMCRRGRGRQ